MIQLTVFKDTHPWQFIPTIIIIDRIVRVEDAGKGMSLLHLTDGSKLTVSESLGHIEKLIREYAEQAQKERAKLYIREVIAEMVNEEIARQLPTDLR